MEKRSTFSSSFGSSGVGDAFRFHAMLEVAAVDLHFLQAPPAAPRRTCGISERLALHLAGARAAARAGTPARRSTGGWPEQAASRKLSQALALSLCHEKVMKGRLQQWTVALEGRRCSLSAGAL